MSEDRVRFSAITVACCVFAVAGLVVGFVIATEVAERFRASLDTAMPSHTVAGAYLAADIHFGCIALVVIGLVASLRRTVRHPVALIITLALPFVCLLAGLSDLYIAGQILDPGWTGH